MSLPELTIAATDVLSQEFCGPLYSSNTSLGSAVSSALASSTPIAIAATAGKDPTDVSNYPPCAVSSCRLGNSVCDSRKC